jgi:hypothetical protein
VCQRKRESIPEAAVRQLRFIDADLFPLVLYRTAFLQNTLACIRNTSNGKDQMNAKFVAQERVFRHVGNIERPRLHKSKDHFKTRSILSDRIHQAGRKIRTRKIVLHNFLMVPARHGDYRPPIDLASKVTSRHTIKYFEVLGDLDSREIVVVRELEAVHPQCSLSGRFLFILSRRMSVVVG